MLAGVGLLATSALAEECLVLEDFAKARVGDFPAEWKPRKEPGRQVYAVAEEGPLRFLRAISRGLGIQAARPHEWDLMAYPVLAWLWRPREFPAGSDEREARSNDSALAVYAVFPHTPWSVKSLKYVWSAIVPTGRHLASSGGLTQVRVLRSGAAGNDAWVEERVNVLADYRTLFQEADPPRPAGIAVLTDSDDTRSRAAGDYARFRVCRP